VRSKASLLLFRNRFVRRIGRLFDLPDSAEAKDRVCRLHGAIVAFSAFRFAAMLLSGVADGVTCAPAGSREAP
jgi:hypothetical protein